MGTVDEILNFRDWVEKLLIVAPMEGRSWKNISHRFGWKVKTHGFPIRGVSVDTIVASRVSLARAQDIILSSSSKRKVDVTQGSEEEEEHDGSSLIRRSRARKRVFSNDEATPRSVSITEPVEATLVSSDDDTHVAARGSDEHLFSRGFDSENLDLVSDEVHLAFYTVSAPVERSLLVFTTIVSAPPQAVMTSSTIPITIISHTEIGSSSESRAMKQIIIEVPANGNLLKKSGQADVWLKPLIGPVEKSKLESHSSLTWMNDIVQSSLKVLISFYILFHSPFIKTFTPFCLDQSHWYRDDKKGFPYGAVDA
uniref:Uncharacterized protein n=1 Tax=Nicotiana tabacum TaxID=4097 RepID=A0A1S3XR27_TOBAC|nr:PREDICTED: uncharacterized protein LOC107767818 [Nicotiana tabacum]